LLSEGVAFPLIHALIVAPDTPSNCPAKCCDEEGRARIHPPVGSRRPHCGTDAGHYRVLRNGKPLRKANGMPFTLPFSPDTTRWRRAATVELRKLGIDLSNEGRNGEAR
jgi:hypothetical protein